MKIKSIGGEFGLIERIKSNVKLYSKEVVAGIGEDAAVLEYDKNNYLLFTTDMLVENDHFSLKYSTPEQIGMKAIEQNASDIAAMGGLPKFAVISLALKNDIDVEFVDKKYLALRNGAKVGDLIFCSGDLGKSTAGLELLRHKLKGKSIKKHLEPECRLDLARKLVKFGINSMIDVSDGIASEVKHICEESDIGAVIYADKIPLLQDTVIDAKKIKKNPLDFALYGGEDFELIFTANKNKLKQLKKYDVKVIGEIVDKKYGIKLIKNRKKLNLESGFDHFKRLRV